MKKTTLLTLLVSLFFPLRSAAEQEYRLARGLSDIGADRLALFILENRARTGASRAEIAAGQGFIHKKLADNERNPVKKDEYYRTAQKGLSEAVAGLPPTDPTRGEIEGILGELELETARARVKRIAETANIDEKAKLRREALAIYDGVLDKFRKAYASSRQAFTELNDQVEKQDDETVRRQRLRERLGRLFDVAVLAGKRYFKACFEVIDAYELNSADQRAFTEKVVAEIDEYIKIFEPHSEYEGAWGGFARGFMLMKSGKPDEAVSGFDVAIQLNRDEWDRRFWKLIDELRQPAFYYKAKSQLEARRYQDAESTCVGFKMEYRDALKDNWGQAVIMVLAESFWAQGKYQQAIQELVKGIEREGPWMANYRQKLAEWYIAAEKKPELLRHFGEAAGVLYAIAQGLYQEKRYDEAIKAYRRAIVACRRPETSRGMKLRYEPSSWYEMGLCYYRLNLAYEPPLAWSEVVLNFSDKYLADQDKANKELLAKIQETVEKAKKNMLASVNLRFRQTRNPADQRLVEWAQKVLIIVNPGAEDEFKYNMAEQELKKVDMVKSPARRREILEDAHKLFSEVKSNTRYYDSSIWKRGFCRYRQIAEFYREWTEIKKQKISQEVLEEMQKLVKDVDAAFDLYERFVEKNPTFDTDVLKVRESFKSTTPVLRAIAHYNVGDFEGLVAIARQAAPVVTAENPNYPTFSWYHFRALIELAKINGKEQKLAVAHDNLKAAETVAKTISQHKDGKRYYESMASYLGAAYGELNTFAAAAGDERLKNEFMRLSAEWMLVALPPDASPMRIISVANLFFQLGMYAEASKLFDRVLQTLDPDGDNKVYDIPEDLFEDLRRKTLADQKTTDAYRALVVELRRCLVDPKTIDYNKATAVLERINKLAPDVEKEVFDKINTEVTNRKMILSARTKNLECYVALASRAAEEGKPAEARALYEQAERDAFSLLKFWPNDRDITFTLGEIYFALGKHLEAAHAFNQTLEFFRGTRQWLVANKRMIEAASLAAKDQEAVQRAFGLLVGFMQGASLDDILEVWPEVKEFEKGLVARGAKPPKVEFRDIAMKVISNYDEKLWSDLDAVEKSLRLQKKSEEEIRAKLRDTVASNFWTRINMTMLTIDANAAAGAYKSPKHVELVRRNQIIVFFAMPCVVNERLRAKVLEIGALTAEEMEDGMPVRFWPPKQLETAIDFKIVDKDGKFLIGDVKAELDNINRQIDELTKKPEGE